MRETAFNSENIEHSGVTVRIDYFYDTDHDAPWKEYDGCGVIREVSSYYGRPEKSPGEVIMHSDRGYYWLYDVQATTEKAKCEGWGLGAEDREKLAAKLGRVPTSGEVTAEAVNRDLAFCRGYLRYDWFYVGVVCTVLDQDGEETEDSDSCWGFESLNSYHETAGREMAEALADTVAKRKREDFTQRMREARERKYWALRDVETVET